MNATSFRSGRRPPNPEIHECPVVQIDEVARGIFLMRLQNPQIAGTALPGQFVNVRIRDEVTPLLRRPFSICSTDRQSGTFDVLWKVCGIATGLMSQAHRGDRFNILGPLGNGFSISSSTKNAIVVAGGLGVAPMPLLVDSLRKSHVEVKVFLGARTAGELWGEEIFAAQGAGVTVSTDDGSRGLKGFVTTLLSEELRKNSDVEAFACGPMPMLSRVSRICLEARVGAQLSVETMMGCGFGICMGCPMTPAEGVKEHGRYLLACMDGPVFFANTIHLEE